MRAGRIDELRELRESGASKIEKQFLEALFEQEGERAAGLFESIWKQFPENPLGWESLSRLQEYYYARGAYLKADSLLQLLNKRPQIELTSPSLPGQIETFWVQVGAFSDFINAANLNVRLEGMGYSVVIRDKIVNNKMLYLVLVGGFKEESGADSVSGAIEKRLPLKTRVVREVQ